jgi:hypothetical protein
LYDGENLNLIGLEEFHGFNPYAAERGIREVAHADQPAGELEEELKNTRSYAWAILEQLGSPDWPYEQVGKNHDRLRSNTEYILDVIEMALEVEGLVLPDDYRRIFGHAESTLRGMDAVAHAAGFRPASSRSDDQFYKKVSAVDKQLREDDRQTTVLAQAKRLLEPFDFEDAYDINRVLDLHVMPVQLLDSDNTQCGALRSRYIEQCRDRTFWHTALSTGRLYNSTQDNFTTLVDERYEGCLDLFPSE